MGGETVSWVAEKGVSQRHTPGRQGDLTKKKL